MTMEIKQIFVKTRAEFGKQCIFDMYDHMEEDIKPSPEAMANYIIRTHCNVGVQHTKQFALHEAQTVGLQTKSSGMFHFEGGWPKEINPRDEEATARFRRRVEKDEEWAPKLRNLFQKMEHNILQNGAVNIHEHYFDDIIPTELVKLRNLRTVNIYEDPQIPRRPVNDISWSPDSGSKIVVSYCFLDFGSQPDYSNIAHIWQIDNPNKPWVTLEPPSAVAVTEFNPRDPSVLVSGLMSGQVCSWDIRTGTTPVQTSHRRFSHRDCTTAIKWITTKSNTEFFSGSADGRAFWWDSRQLRRPIEILVFDLQAPNEPRMDRAIGVSSANFEPLVSTRFMFGLENGVVISGSRKARTPAEKLALRFSAHYGPVASVDRNGSNPKIFLTVGDCIARVWAEDTKDGSLVSTRFIKEDPICGCWNRTRHSIFYVATRSGVLTVWDLLMGLYDPIVTVKLGEQKLTAIAAHDRGALLAVGNSAGNVYLVESTEALYSFDKNERNDFASYLERCSRFVRAIDTRLKEIKLMRIEETPELEYPKKKVNKPATKVDREKSIAKRQELQKEHRPKSRVYRDKRKPRDESPEIQEAEKKFFEIVEKEKQSYDEDKDLPVKKSVARKIENSRLIIDEVAKEIKTKTSRKKIIGPEKGAKIAITETEVSQDVEQEKITTEEPVSPPVEVSETVESPAKKISKRMRRKVTPKKRLMPVAFKLPRPCKVGVCKPDICCPETATKKLSSKPADRKKCIRNDKTKWKDDVEVDTSVGRRQRKKESWPRLLRAYKREKAVDKRKRIRFLQEMTAPHKELAEDVKRARREIQVVRLSAAAMRTRELAKKALKRATIAEKSRVTPRRSRRDEGTGGITPSTTKRVLAARERRKVRRAAVTVDPCTPWKPPLLEKDLQALLGVPLPESIEEEAFPPTTHAKETEAARRIYPRISDFHLIE